MGLYQESAMDARIYVSADGGETFSMCYQNTDKQHVHLISVDRTTTPNEVYAGLDDGASTYRPLCVKTSDHGTTWIEVPVPYRCRDYFPAYCGNGYKLGGGESNSLGGVTLYKTTDAMDADAYYTVINTTQGIRTVMSPAEGVLICGGCAGRTDCIDQIFLSKDEGETWQTVYAENWSRSAGVGDGVRWFTEAFTPMGSSEEQVIITGNSRDYWLRAKFGDTYHYGLCYVSLGSLPTTGRTIKVKYGYAMKYPKRTYKKRDIVTPVLWLPLNEGNGRIVKEQITGNLCTITGDYAWEKNNSVRYGGFQFTNQINNGTALKLATGSYIKLGTFTNLSFNKDCTIAFWASTGYNNQDWRLSGVKKVILQNQDIAMVLENAWEEIWFPSENIDTHTMSNPGILSSAAFNLFYLTITNDALPTIAVYVNDATEAIQPKMATAWGTGLFSDSDLYIGCPNPTDIIYTFPHSLAHIMVFDKVLSTEERRDIYHGCTLLERS